MTNVLYIRVSSLTQNTGRQEALIDTIKPAKVFIDKASGRDTNRPELKAMLSWVREGDCIHVSSIDRLARSVSDLRAIVDDLQQRGISIRFHKEGLCFNGKPTPTDTLMLNLLGSIGEFERSIIKERQREGIELAKRAGKYKGRKKAYSLAMVQSALDQVDGNRTKAAAILGCPVQTVRRVLREGV